MTVEAAGYSYSCAGTCTPEEAEHGLVVARDAERREERAGLVITSARHHLDAMFDPFALDPFELHLEQRITTCGEGRRRKFRAGQIRSSAWRCNYRSRCVRCAAWQVGTRSATGSVEGGPAAWLRLYDRMDPRLFAGVDVVYWQPVPLGGALPRDVPEVRRLADRARDRGVTDWVRIDTLGAANYFSAGTLHREGDAEHPWRLTGEEARRFFFGELLLPCVVQHKPTAGKRSAWALPTGEEAEREAGEGDGSTAGPDIPSVELGTMYDGSWSGELDAAVAGAVVTEWPDGADWANPVVLARVQAIDAEQRVVVGEAVRARRARHEAARRRG